MLKKIRMLMAYTGSIYWIENLIEFDDNYVDGKCSGKRWPGVEGESRF